MKSQQNLSKEDLLDLRCFIVNKFGEFSREIMGKTTEQVKNQLLSLPAFPGIQD